MSLRWLFNAGEKLSVVLAKHKLYLPQIAKYNVEAAKMLILDTINIHFLMGTKCTLFSIFDGIICDENALIHDANTKKNLFLVSAVYMRQFFVNFWMDDYEAARQWHKKFASFTKYAGPQPLDLIITGVRGVIAFQLYMKGGGDKFFEEGKEMLKELEAFSKWDDCHVKTSILILKAEMLASDCEVKKAKEAYETAITSARNDGTIPQLACGKWSPWPCFHSWTLCELLT